MIVAEIKRALSSTSFLIALGVGLLFALAHILTVAVPYAFDPDWSLVQAGSKGVYPNSLLNSWIGATPYALSTSLFFFALPLLVCLPHAGTLYTDLKSGFISSVITRCSIKDYLVAKAVAVFLSGGIIGIAPLLFNFLGTAMLLPALTPEPAAGIFNVPPTALLADLFYAQPWAYLLFFLVFDFILCGIIACSCFVFSFLVSNKFVVVVAPFLVCVITYFALGDASGYSPINLLNPSQSHIAQLIPTLASYVIIACAITLFVVWKYRRFEVV